MSIPERMWPGLESANCLVVWENGLFPASDCHVLCHEARSGYSLVVQQPPFESLFQWLLSISKAETFRT